MTEKIKVICGCPLRSYHAPVRSFGVAEICIYPNTLVYAQRDYASKLYAQKGDALKLYASKGICLLTVCLKGTMPYDCMPQRDYAL